MVAVSSSMSAVVGGGSGSKCRRSPVPSSSRLNKKARLHTSGSCAPGNRRVSLTISWCRFIDNHLSSYRRGSGFFVMGSMVRFRGCEIMDNFCRDGGGACVVDSPGSAIVNCTFLENTGGLTAGAILLDAADIALES